MTCTCSRVEQSGMARVLVALTAEQWEGVAYSTSDADTRERALIAIGLVDWAREIVVRRDLQEAGLMP